MTNIDTVRYSRQISLDAIGRQGQERLRDARVLLLGAGGLGNPAALYLASSGVGHINIYDFDTVDVTNLPRQVLYRDADAGKPKAEILALRLQELNPNCTALGISRRLAADALAAEITRSDVVLDCTDNFQSRWLINAGCYAQQTPLVSGATIRFEGQLAVFPYRDGAGPCYRCLYSEADENLLDCAGQGILAPVAGTVGCMMATETIKVLLRLDSALNNALWLYDGLAGTSRTVGITAQAACPVCATTTKA
jgi:molybdopterin/thiamine biosynthesis adenylyltransferase